MAIDFYMGESKEKINFSEFITFEEEIQQVLSNYFFKKTIPLGIRFLIELDLYEKIVFGEEKIKMILKSIAEINSNCFDNKANEFLNELYKFFTKAVEQNKNIYVIGD